MTSEEKREAVRLRHSGLSYSKIAATLNISENTVKSFCRRNSISGSASTHTDEADKKDIGGCKQCGKSLAQIPKQKQKKFCCPECRFAWWNANREHMAKKAVYHFKCKCCGKKFDSYGNKNRKYCSHACYIKDYYYSEER